MLVRVLGLDVSLPRSNPFPDVLRTRWSAPWIEAAKTLGYVQGYDDGEFKPESPATRAELAALLVRDAEARGALPTGEAGRFADVPEGKWYAGYVGKASALGLVNGYEGGTFRPEAPVTRAEAVVMINRAFGRDPGTAPALAAAANPFTDIAEEHWAYMHVLEASVAHEHALGKSVSE
jgi:hypothetical protein